MKRTVAFCLAIFALLALVSCAGEEPVDPAVRHREIASQPIETELGTFRYTEEETDYVCVQMENGGKIIIELDASAAPLTVKNFQNLVKAKFYDGLIFHRVDPGFVIQGGCPQGTGLGGPGYTIKGEFEENGVQNPIKHVRGTVSMARRGTGYNTAGSQFFIVHSTKASNSKSLDGKYAAFGKVIHGMDVVDAIAGVAAASERPLVEQKMVLVYFVTSDSVQKPLTETQTNPATETATETATTPAV